jgi:hypothetical protein
MTAASMSGLPHTAKSVAVRGRAVLDTTDSSTRRQTPEVEPLQPCIPGTVDLAHPGSADGGLDLVGTETSTGDLPAIVRTS